MKLSNIVIGFQDAFVESQLLIVPDKKMLFVENEATGSRFKLDSKFIRRDEPVDMQTMNWTSSDENDVVNWLERPYDLKLRGSVVINRCTYNPFLLRSKQDPESSLINVTLNINKVVLLKYETAWDIISTLKNKRKGIVSATVCCPELTTINEMNDHIDIMRMYCYNIATTQYIRIDIGVENGEVVINTTAELNKDELKYCRNNTRYHKGRSLTFKHKTAGRPKYFVSTNVPVERYQDSERVYIQLSKPAKDFPVDKETNIRWDLLKEIKGQYLASDNVKAIEIDKSVDLTFEEIYELKLSYVFTEEDDGTLRCLKSN